MKKLLTTVTMALILSASFGAVAGDGNFTGNVSLQAPHTQHATNGKRVIEYGTAGDHDSSIVFTQKTKPLPVSEELGY